jgi:excisionase family DNA binding protein
VEQEAFTSTSRLPGLTPTWGDPGVLDAPEFAPTRDIHPPAEAARNLPTPRRGGSRGPSRAPAARVNSAPTPLADAARRLRGAPGRPRMHPAPASAVAPKPRHVPVTSAPLTRMDGGLQARPPAGDACALPALAPRLLGLKAAAGYLGVGTGLIRRLLETGALNRVDLAGARRLLIDREDLDRLIDASRTA